MSGTTQPWLLPFRPCCSGPQRRPVGHLPAQHAHLAGTLDRAVGLPHVCGGGGVGGAQQPPAAISVTTCEGKAPGAVAAPWRLTRSAWMRLPAALDAPVAAIAAFAMRASLIPIPVPPPCPRPNPPAPPQGLPARHGVLRGADGGAAREPVGAGPPLRRPLLLLVRARVQGMAPRPVHTSRESSNGGVPCTPAGHAPALTARDQLSEDGTCTLVAAAWRGPPPQPGPALGALPRSNRPLQGRL